MANKTTRENVEILARHGALPSRDILLAADQMTKYRETVDSINKHIQHMRTNPLAMRQAD